MSVQQSRCCHLVAEQEPLHSFSSDQCHGPRRRLAVVVHHYGLRNGSSKPRSAYRVELRFRPSALLLQEQHNHMATDFVHQEGQEYQAPMDLLRLAAPYAAYDDQRVAGSNAGRQFGHRGHSPSLHGRLDPDWFASTEAMRCRMSYPAMSQPVASGSPVASCHWDPHRRQEYQTVGQRAHYAFRRDSSSSPHLPLPTLVSRCAVMRGGSKD